MTIKKSGLDDLGTRMGESHAASVFSVNKSIISIL